MKRFLGKIFPRIRIEGGCAGKKLENYDWPEAQFRRKLFSLFSNAQSMMPAIGRMVARFRRH